MPYFCGWCGKVVGEDLGDIARSVWQPFDSRECASAYGLRAATVYVERGMKTGLRYATKTGVRAPKEQARGVMTRCARCSSEDAAVYLELGNLKSFTCYSCGLEYDELPDGTLLRSRDDEAKSFTSPNAGVPHHLDALRRLREAIQEHEEDALEASRRNSKARRGRGHVESKRGREDE